MIQKFASFMESKTGRSQNTNILAVKALNLKFVQPNRDELSLLKYNPAMAGHLAMHFTSLRELAGLEYANKTRCLVLAAYLYQLAQIVGTSTVRWSEMDHIIQIHGKAM